MKRINSIDDLKLGQHVWVGYNAQDGYAGIVELLSKGMHGTQGELVRVYKSGTDPLQTSAWLDLTFDPIWDVDTDEERQEIHEAKLAEHENAFDEEHSFNLEEEDPPDGDWVVMGPVSRFSPTRTMNRPEASGAAQVLYRAAAILEERGRRYDNETDDVEGSYPAVRRTATMWSSYLGTYIAPEQVCDLMALHKLARCSVDRNGGDHREDGINYLAIGEDLR